ncbi:AAA family ATPase [Aquisalinus flavus]|nr:AAA family ATPase [Aquisalinus flavus]
MRTDDGKRRQLPLPFGTPSPADDLPPILPSATNEEARRMLQAWEAGLGDPNSSHSMLIAGPPGTGKTLLLAYVARDTGVPIHKAEDICDRQNPLPDDPVVLVDDIHLCEPTDVMRLINVCIERGRIYVFAGTGNPRDWAGEGAERLDDLASRLSATPTARLEKPDEALMTEAIQQMLADRQVKIAWDVAAVAAMRLKRSFHAVRQFVEVLDSEALERQKKIDKALVQHVLASIPGAIL